MGLFKREQEDSSFFLTELNVTLSLLHCGSRGTMASESGQTGCCLSSYSRAALARRSVTDLLSSIKMAPEK